MLMQKRLKSKFQYTCGFMIYFVYNFAKNTW